MSLSISAVSQNSPVVEANPTPQAPPKLTQTEEIKLLSVQGQTDQQIANVVGLPLALVDTALGNTTLSSSTTTTASALVALSGRLSIYS